MNGVMDRAWWERVLNVAFIGFALGLAWGLKDFYSHARFEDLGCSAETVQTLARQRFRWAYGTLQCLWKHRDMVFNWNYRALGWFSLPSIWFFQIILIAITPIIDLFLLASLPFGAWNAVLPFVITFLAMDVLLATLACILEREPMLRAWRILPMRLIYRPMLSYCIWKAILRAVKGAWVSWGKLERTASVPVRA